MLRYSFDLNGDKNEKYPNLGSIVESLRKNMKLTLFLEERSNKRYPLTQNGILSHELLSEKFLIGRAKPNRLHMAIAGRFGGYLWQHVLYAFTNLTAELGGGVIDVDCGEPELIAVTPDNLENVYETLYLSNDMAWVPQPYDIAKDIEGFRN